MRYFCLTAALLCGCAAPTADEQPQPYPQGPYGVQSGDVLSPEIAWQGFIEGEPEPRSVTAREYFETGTSALLITTSTFHCTPCYEESQELETWMDRWEPLGIRVALLILDNPDEGAARIEDARKWKTSFGLTRVGVFADPQQSIVVGENVTTPEQIVVDPTTMTVLERRAGVPSAFDTLEHLARRNEDPR